MQKQKESLLSQRGQIALVGVSLWLLLALWSIAAFWEHVDGLNVAYPVITKLGAASGEVALLALVLWHCFNKHISVRKWSAIFGFFLGAAILIHAGALRGMGEARSLQVDTEKRLEEQLTKMSKEQMQSSRRKVEIAKSAQKELAETVRGGAEKVKDTSILPRWYLDGWMYSVLFILSLGCISIVGSMMRNKEDIDTNFDGVPDHLQPGNAFVLASPVEGFARASKEQDPKD
jgi:hypothetical protein